MRQHRRRRLTSAGLIGADHALGRSRSTAQLHLGQPGTTPGLPQQQGRSIHARRIADRRWQAEVDRPSGARVMQAEPLRPATGPRALHMCRAALVGQLTSTDSRAFVTHCSRAGASGHWQPAWPPVVLVTSSDQGQTRDELRRPALVSAQRRPLADLLERSCARDPRDGRPVACLAATGQGTACCCASVEIRHQTVNPPVSRRGAHGAGEVRWRPTITAQGRRLSGESPPATVWRHGWRP